MFVMRLSWVGGAGATPGTVFSRVVEVLHLTAANYFAVSFPEARNGSRTVDGAKREPSLGKTLLVYSPDQTRLMEMRDALGATGGLADYLHIGRIAEIDADSDGEFVSHHLVRSHHKTAAWAERKIRRAKARAATRGTEMSEEYAADLLRQVGAGAAETRLPYLNIRSLSTRKRFTLSFATARVKGPAKWQFDSYGFAQDGAAVPAL